MKKFILAISFILGIFAISHAVKVYAQSANILAVQNMSSDCSQVYLNDAAGTVLGPYSNAIADQRLTQATQDKARLSEQEAEDDAKIAGASIALQAFNACYATLNATTNSTNGT